MCYFFVSYYFVAHNLSHHIQLRQKKIAFFFVVVVAMALYFSTLFQFCFKNVTGSGFPTLMEGQTKKGKEGKREDRIENALQMDKVLCEKLESS